MKLVEANGTAIACDDAGEGAPPFVFIHGYACDRSAWAPQFDDLSRDHRCISVDLRGCGDSPPAFPSGIETAADDVFAVMTALDCVPAIIAGHSLGGLIALVLNERHPEVVRGTLVGDSPIREPLPRDRRPAPPAEPHEQYIARLVETFWSQGTPEHVKARVRGMMLGCSAEVARGMEQGYGAAMARMPELLKLADAKPFMAIWAGKALGDPAWVRDVTMFVRQEPIAGTGHFFQLEEPQITNALLRAFEDDVRRDPRLAAMGLAV